MNYQFPFNWVPQRVGSAFLLGILGFTAVTSFPFNWVPQRVGSFNPELCRSLPGRLFPFNWVPQRVGRRRSRGEKTRSKRKFPFNWVPQRVGRCFKFYGRVHYNMGFHLIGFPSEWGVKKPLGRGGTLWFSFHLIGFPSEWGD